MTVKATSGGTPTPFPTLSGGDAALGWTVANSLADGEVMTITTNGTYNFTAKVNAKPLLWWKADEGGIDGQTISSLGRKTVWDGAGFAGSLSPAQAPAGSTEALRYDHGDLNETNEGEDAILAQVNFSSPSMYMFRKVYQDFDVLQDFAVAAWLTTSTITGTFAIGDTVTDTTTGNTGVIEGVKLANAGTITIIYFSKAGGNVGYPTNAPFTQNGNVTSNNAAPGSATNQYADATGLQRTFNYKIFRAKAELPDINNIYVSEQGWNDSNSYKLSAEWTDSTKTLTQVQKPNVWVTEELDYEDSSGLDVADGVMRYWQDGVNTYPADNVIHKVSGQAFVPGDIDGAMYAINQLQVSNGAQLNSFTYIECLYIDDTRHRVVISDEAIWNENSVSNVEVQIPVTWTVNNITVSLRKGEFVSLVGNYLYVINDAGAPVSTSGVLI